MTTVTVSASELLKAIDCVSPWREKGSGLLSCVHLLHVADGLQLTTSNGSSACRVLVGDASGADRALEEYYSCLLTRAGVRLLKQLLRSSATAAIDPLLLDISPNDCYLPPQPLSPAVPNRPTGISEALRKCYDCPSYLPTKPAADYPIALIDRLLKPSEVDPGSHSTVPRSHFVSPPRIDCNPTAATTAARLTLMKAARLFIGPDISFYTSAESRAATVYSPTCTFTTANHPQP